MIFNLSLPHLTCLCLFICRRLHGVVEVEWSCTFVSITRKRRLERRWCSLV